MGRGRIAFKSVIAAAALCLWLTACKGKADEAAPSSAAPDTRSTATSGKPQNWNSFADPGWTVEKVIEGRLTQGGDGDVVLLLHGTDPAKKIKNEGLGEQELDLNPRMLVFLEHRGKQYRKAGQVANFLPPASSEENPCLADPLGDGDVSISANVVEIRLQYWFSCGSWYITNETYKFRKEGERFRLIGFDRLEFHRASHDQETTSINFLTGKREISAGNEDSEPPKPTVTKMSRIGNEKYWLDTLPQGGCQGAGDGLSWCFDSASGE